VEDYEAPLLGGVESTSGIPPCRDFNSNPAPITLLRRPMVLGRPAVSIIEARGLVPHPERSDRCGDSAWWVV